MAQEVQAMPISPWLKIGSIVIPLILLILFILLEVYLFKKDKKSLAIGGIIGFILLIVNSIFLGFLGAFFWIPFSFLSLCGGESCWGPIIFVGDMGFLLLGYLFGWVVGNIKK